MGRTSVDELAAVEILTRLALVQERTAWLHVQRLDPYQWSENAALRERARAVVNELDRRNWLDAMKGR